MDKSPDYTNVAALDCQAVLDGDYSWICSIEQIHLTRTLRGEANIKSVRRGKREILSEHDIVTDEMLRGRGKDPAVTINVEHVDFVTPIDANKVVGIRGSRLMVDYDSYGGRANCWINDAKYENNPRSRELICRPIREEE